MKILNFENPTPPILLFISFLIFTCFFGFAINFAKNNLFPQFFGFLMLSWVFLIFSTNFFQTEIMQGSYKRYLAKFTTEEIYNALNGNEHTYKTKLLLKKYLVSINPQIKNGNNNE
jgi:hypothetical protein